MTFDGFVTRALTYELKDAFLNGRVTKIYQPFEQELQLVIRSHRHNYRLAASIHPTHYNVHLTNERPLNPTHAPMFCMLLRKHLENAVVLDVRQIDNDRILELELSGRDELGDLYNYALIFELMGKHSNIILVNQATQTIIDCMKHVPPSLNTYRTLQPGATYRRPPHQDTQHNIFALSDSQLQQFALQHADLLLRGHATQCVQGMSRPLAHAIAHWMTVSTLSPYDALKKAMSYTQSPTPTLYQTGNKWQYYIGELSQFMPCPTESYNTLSELLDVFYTKSVHNNRVQQVSGNLKQKLTTIIERNVTKLQKLDADRKVAQQAQDYRIKGELLNAYAYQIEKGQTTVTLDNYYNDNLPITIDIDPRKSAIENSQVFFKKYTKYRDALQFIDEQERLATEENDYLNGILLQLSQADVEDVEAIKQELMEQGYSSQRKSSEKKRAAKPLPPRQFQSSDGTRLLVGRNNAQNDTLSLKQANKRHWWLHAKNIPGAHVIIESEYPSDDTFTQAGQLAAYYSTFQHSANVPIDVVQVKHLKKPNGAKPGFVIYEGQRTIYVTPDEALIAQLKIENPPSA